MKINYKKPRIRVASKSRPVSTREIKIDDPQDTPGLINGMKAGSSYEWFIARALWALGWMNFDYQVPLFGGRSVRGGIVVDFIVPTRPAQTVISVIGEYWHRNTDEDAMEDMRVKDYMGMGVRVLRPGTPECSTFDLALQFCQREIGRA